MKILALQPLGQFGVPCYKGTEVEVSDELGKKLVEGGYAKELSNTDSEGQDLTKLKLVELRELCSTYPSEEWEGFKKKVDLIQYLEAKAK